MLTPGGIKVKVALRSFSSLAESSSLKLELYAMFRICQHQWDLQKNLDPGSPWHLGRTDAVHDHASSEDQELRGPSAAPVSLHE